MTFEPPPPPPGFGGGPPPLPGGPVRPPRPVTVTAAVGLMATQVVLSFIGAVVPLLMKSEIVDAYRRMPTPSGQAKVDPDTQFLMNTGGGACLTVAAAIIFGVLAFFLLRGANVARIITWVLGGLSLCCTGFGVIGLAMMAAAKLPGAYIGTVVVTGGLSFVITIVVIVLLALPVSNAFFKPKAQGQLY